MAKKPSTAVAKPKGTAVSTNVRPVGRGFEEADADSYAIPFLVVLQKLSPACDSDSADYIKGAKPGMFMNTVTKELFDEVTIIPCVYQRRFNRWAPRDLGGGFKGMVMPSLIAKLEAESVIAQNDEGRWFYAGPDGSVNEKKCDILTDTRMHFCMMENDDKWEQVLIALSRTQLKHSRNWMSNMQRLGGDMFDNAFTAKTKDEENDKGKWKGWVISFERGTDEGERATAIAFYESVAAGKVEVKMEQERTAASSDD